MQSKVINSKHKQRAPKISVLMPVYNGERFLREAVESILLQTFTGFELIIVDDGSVDGTSTILDSYDDSRIIRLVNTSNIGLNRSLNLGLSACRGEFIARMDADDIATPDRLATQVVFLNKHPEVGILSSSCQSIDADGQRIGMYVVPTTDLEIRWTALLASPFAHPAVMMRRDVLVKNDLRYDEDETFWAVEDYELWTRILRHTHGANLSEPLVQVRVHQQSQTGRYREIQLENHDRIAWRTIREHAPSFIITPEQVSQLRALFVGGSEFISDFDERRVALTALYFELFKEFERRHRGEHGLRALKSQEALKMGRTVLQFPRLPGWMRMFWRLLFLHPSVVRFLLRRLSCAGYHRAKRFLGHFTFRRRKLIGLT